MSLTRAIIFAASFTVLTASLFTVATPVLATESILPECSVAQLNSIVVENNQVLFVSDSIGPVSTTIPAGEYTIDYLSYDDHAGHGGQNQLEEQWTFTAHNNSNALYTSNPTNDIAEEVDIVSGTFGTVTFTEDIDAITFDHNIASWTNANGPESVYPVCVSFTAVEKPACIHDETLSADDKDCTAPQVLGAISPPVTTLPNTGAGTIVISVMSIGALSASVRNWVDSKKLVQSKNPREPKTPLKWGVFACYTNYMSKKKARSQKRKRNKAYTGNDAVAKTPEVTRIKAVKKSAFQEWLDDNRVRIKALAVIAAVLIILLWLIPSFFRWVFQLLLLPCYKES